jgi:hypothetical protein
MVPEGGGEMYASGCAGKELLVGNLAFAYAANG